MCVCQTHQAGTCCVPPQDPTCPCPHTFFFFFCSSFRGCMGCDLSILPGQGPECCVPLPQPRGHLNPVLRLRSSRMLLRYCMWEGHSSGGSSRRGASATQVHTCGHTVCMSLHTLMGIPRDGVGSAVLLPCCEEAHGVCVYVCVCGTLHVSSKHTADGSARTAASCLLLPSSACCKLPKPALIAMHVCKAGVL